MAITQLISPGSITQGGTLLTVVPGGTDTLAIHVNIASEISAITEKAIPIDADLIVIEDSADSNIKKRVQLGNIEATPGGLDTEVQFNNATLFDGDSNFIWNNTTKRLMLGDTLGIAPLAGLHLNNGVGTLSTGITFGDGDTGFYESADDVLQVRMGGTGRFAFSNTNLATLVPNGGILIWETPSATNPSFTFTNDTDTGIGTNTDDQLSIIAGAKEIARASEATTEQFIINPQADLTGTLAAPNLAFGFGNTGFTELIDNELSIIANATEVARVVVTPGNERFIINPQADYTGSATAPNLAFGTGNTGFYESADNLLKVTINGTATWRLDGTAMGGADNGSGVIQNTTSSATIPTILPDNTDSDTGIGHAAGDSLSLIAGAKEMLRLVETGTATTDQIIIAPVGIIGTAATPALAFGDGDTGIYEPMDDTLNFSLGGSARFYMDGTRLASYSANSFDISRFAASATSPVYRFVGDSNTGIGWAGMDQLSLIAGGVESMRLTATDITTSLQVTIDDVLQLDSTPTVSTPIVGMWRTNAITPEFYNGSGWINLSSGGGGIGGADSNIQFNALGSFSAESKLIWNSTTKRVRIGDTIGAAPLAALHLDSGVGTLATGITFGDGDTGFYELSDDILKVRVGGVPHWFFSTNIFQGEDPVGPAMVDVGPEVTVPNFLPNYNDTDTGIGGDTADTVSIIAGGKEIARAAEATTEQLIINPQADLTGTIAAPSLAFGDGDTGFYEFSDDRLDFTGASLQGSNTSSFVISNITSSRTVPVYSGKFGADAGMGFGGITEVSIIAGSVEGLRVKDGLVSFVGSVKTTTGDPAGPVSGSIQINEFDNVIKIYADGAWRTLVSW